MLNINKSLTSVLPPKKNYYISILRTIKWEQMDEFFFFKTKEFSFCFYANKKFFKMLKLNYFPLENSPFK